MGALARARLGELRAEGMKLVRERDPRFAATARRLRERARVCVAQLRLHARKVCCCLLSSGARVVRVGVRAGELRGGAVRGRVQRVQLVGLRAHSARLVGQLRRGAARCGAA